MKYLQLSLPATESEFPEIESRLEETGALSVSTTDAKDNPILEPKPGETPLWQELIVTALFPIETPQTQLQKLFPEAKMRILADQNWERAWLKDYKPIQFGKRLWVGPHDFTPPADMQAILFLDPGLAFGTGTHPTTYLCLEWLSQQDLAGKTVLDFGCGSGILALAALKLGATHITGIDIDPQALVASQENAIRNEIDPQKCTWLLADSVASIKVDIVIANVLANPLIELADTLIHCLQPEGKIVLSGILTEQAEAVKSAYLADITWLEPQKQKEWMRLVGKVRERL